MTDIAAIRERHVRLDWIVGGGPPVTCATDDLQPWPCDAAQLLALLADTPSVEPGLDETRDPWRCPTCGAGLHGTDVEHAALPTQASDSPEKTT